MDSVLGILADRIRQEPFHPAAMTISAMLLSEKFFALSPSRKFKYATLGLLFVNISVGGTLTSYAAPPVLMVAGPWQWDTGFMLANLGWKAVVGILTANLGYFLLFRTELKSLQETFAMKSLKDEIQQRSRLNTHHSCCLSRFDLL
ncbi:MAG: putative Na+/H+ antiporter [Thermodesulfobacteriota bacterium]